MSITSEGESASITEEDGEFSAQSDEEYASGSEEGVSPHFGKPRVEIPPERQAEEPAAEAVRKQPKP